MEKRKWDDMTDDERNKYINKGYLSNRKKVYITFASIDNFPDESEPYEEYSIPKKWLKDLTKRQEEVLKLRFEDGMTERRVAEVLGVAHQTVHEYLEYALKKVKYNIESLPS
jgi:RNA polymerase sigma factor (sigma-70 family)